MLERHLSFPAIRLTGLEGYVVSRQSLKQTVKEPEVSPLGFYKNHIYINPIKIISNTTLWITNINFYETAS